MPSTIEVIPGLAEGALIAFPELVHIPIVGRILLGLAAGHGGETKAAEDLQKVADKKKVDRKTRVQRNNRYVIKASKAMECVETNLMDGKVLLSVLKGLANALLGRDATGPDLLVDKIWTCIEENVLRQDTPRSKPHDVRYSRRPRKGHGHGRGKK